MNTKLNPEASTQETTTVRVKHLDHLNITVRDMDESLEFYEKVFGFRIVEDARPDNWVIIRSGEAMLCLYEHPDLPTGPRYPAPAVYQEVRHFALRVESDGSLERTLRTLDIPVLHGGPVRWPHSTSYYISDPTGHQIEAVCWDEDTVQFTQ